MSMEKYTEKPRLNFEVLTESKNNKKSQDLPIAEPQDQSSYANFEIAGRHVPEGGYSCTETSIEFARENPNQAKFDLMIDGDPNLGWKGHLNVTPENCGRVAEYLIANGYRHKFLQGGEPQDGKLFTVYFGSRDMVDKWAEQLSSDLDELLARPTDETEIEFARGVVGRFAVRGGDGVTKYTPYGTAGMPLLKSEFANREKGQRYQDYVDNLSNSDVQEIYEQLVSDYGKYFTG